MELKKKFPNKNFIVLLIKTFYDSCSVKHYRLNQIHSHPINNLNNINILNKISIKEEKCMTCGIIHRNAPIRIFYDCQLCKGCICFLYKKNT